METRQTTEVKLYLLILNPMQDRTETRRMYAVSYEREKLVNLYNSEKCEPYSDPGFSGFTGGETNWHKVFKKGGPLEWANPVFNDDLIRSLEHYGHGIIETWVPPGSEQTLAHNNEALFLI